MLVGQGCPFDGVVPPEKFIWPDGTRAVGDTSNFLAVPSLVVAAFSRRCHRFGEAFRCVDGLRARTMAVSPILAVTSDSALVAGVESTDAM